MRTKTVILTESQYETIKEVSKIGEGYVKENGITNDLRMAMNFAARVTGTKPCVCNPTAVFSNLTKALEIYVPQFNQTTEINAEVSSTEATSSEDPEESKDNQLGE